MYVKLIHKNATKQWVIKYVIVKNRNIGHIVSEDYCYNIILVFYERKIISIVAFMMEGTIKLLIEGLWLLPVTRSGILIYNKIESNICYYSFIIIINEFATLSKRLPRL